jgi:hypothetical protein
VKRALLLVVCVGLGCGYRPDGIADTTTGLVGVPVAEGALAGDWAVVVELPLVVGAGVLGDKPATVRSHYVVRRAWTDGAYQDTWVRCLRDAAEVAGSRALVPNGSYAKLTPFSSVAHAAHDQGTFATDAVVETWGLHGLPDAATTELPTRENYQQAPQRDWLFDEDEDGHLGVTRISHGTVSGSMYLVERTVFTLTGTVLSEARVQGISAMQSNQSNRLEATSGWLLGEGAAKVDPSRVSWFDAARLQAGAGCAELAAAVEAGDVSITKPF